MLYPKYFYNLLQTVYIECNQSFVFVTHHRFFEKSCDISTNTVLSNKYLQTCVHVVWSTLEVKYVYWQTRMHGSTAEAGALIPTRSRRWFEILHGDMSILS